MNLRFKEMDKLDQILESLYSRVIEPCEAKPQLMDLFNVELRPQITEADETIKAIVRGVEEKTGEKIVSVSGHFNKEECPYCGRTEPCNGSYPEGCLYPKQKQGK
jgi:hypothetical protein